MGRFMLQYCILWFHLLFFHLPSFYTSSLVPLCNHGESFALLRFCKSFTLSSSASDECVYHNQSSLPKTTSWENGTNCCLWDGVTCDTKSGHVIGLDLSCSWLQGKFHPNSTLFQLTHLQNLNLAFNKFLDSPMFSAFGDLVSLTHLNLSTSGFGDVGGAIPSKISHLSKLVSLDLSHTWLRFAPSTWENLILNASAIWEVSLNYVVMFYITPRYLSLLMNLSSSLVSVSLQNTGLQGNFTNEILCLPKLQKLDLSKNGLMGQLPKSNWSRDLRYFDLSITSFSGEVPNSINHSKSLSYLDLSDCNFEGKVPISFWNLTHLTYLSLRGNNFSGEIPSSLSNLQHLTFLDLAFNNLNGHIPDVFGKLGKLDVLSLSNNSLGGQFASSLFDLTKLSILDCSFNKLFGPLPNKIKPIGKFSTYSLRYCFLNNNKLQGNIPDSIFEFRNLSILLLSSNNFSGSVDFYQFSKLQFLERFDLSHINYLSLNSDNNIDYTIPNLIALALSSCNIHGFPTFLKQLQNFQQLDLSNNKIHGRIPKWFNKHLSFSWRNIQVIDLSFNMLQGDLPIPPNGTIFFSVSNNNLTGGISSAICNSSSIRILNLSHNNLTGMVPHCIGTIQSLSVLDLQMNNIYGIVPGNFSEGNVLETIKFNGNQLSGPLPRSLAHCQQLQVLDLGENNIEDTFPKWLEPLQELRVLVLRANKFHGVVTPLKTNNIFPNLKIFDVSSNNFNGPLPVVYIKNFKGMMNVSDHPTGLEYMKSHSMFGSSYNDSVVITWKGNVIELERILTTFTTIDLSNNMFEKEIPEVIGELISLIGLNFSHNRLIGNIPQGLGDLRSLEWLDLSSNKLMGNIPLALTNLNYLSFLNLSQNLLEGIIPTGRQFNTFQNDSYEGNLGLCGFPLSKSCNKDEEEPLLDPTTFDHEEQFRISWKVVAMGYACGLAFGMLLGYVVFSTAKPQWLVQFVGCAIAEYVISSCNLPL